MSGTHIGEADDLFLRCLEDLQKLREENPEPAVFWPRYLDALREVCSAEAAMIAVRVNKEGTAWQPVAFSPASLRGGSFAQKMAAKLDAMDEACSEAETRLLDEEGQLWVGVRLKAGGEGQRCLALFHFGDALQTEAVECMRILELLNDVPANYQLCRTAHDAVTRREQFANVLDLMTLMNAQEKFLSAAMTFCNELASRHHCERVSLGWHKDGYLHLQAASHVDDFDKKMEVVTKLELAMEEAFDQDTEIILPNPKDSRAITRQHEAFSRAQGVAYVCSMPLRVNGSSVGVCTFERSASAFTEVELRLMRLCCDQAVRRLEDLKSGGRWFGARLAAQLVKNLEGAMGYRYTGAKILAVAGALALAFVRLVPVTYRLESPVILRSEDVSFMTAPFDGHIERVEARVGDSVPAGNPLLTLDQSELLLEEAGLTAEKNRYQREYEKARAANALADMRIADALYEQASARLDLVRHRLSQAVIRAPHDVVVVEGDMKERVGSPVKQGDILFKVGRTDKIYAELEVPESEIHHVNTSLNGEISLASRPEDTYKMKVVRVEPAAVVKDDGNVFLVRCEFPNEVPSWWKPGMTGVSKLNARRHTLLWIFTHRTMDFLRLKLWW